MKGFVKFLRVLAGIAVTAGIVVLVVFFVRQSKPVIYDLRAYLEHSISGYDGEAVMNVSVDKNGLAEDILPQLKKKDHDAYKSLTEAIKSGQSGSFIDTLFEMTVSDTEALSNGDVVTVRFSYDNEAVAHYGIAFTGDTEEIKVENLEEIRNLDLFADLQLDFTGISPYLTTDERIFFESDDAYVVCTVSPADHLKAGDLVMVTMDPDESELPEGTRALETSRQIKVDQTDAFIMKPEELTEKDQKRIRSQCEKALQTDGAFSGRTVIPELEEEAQFKPEDAGLQVSHVQLMDNTSFYADDGTLGCTDVISQETPDLMAVYYECDIAEAKEPVPSAEEKKQENEEEINAAEEVKKTDQADAETEENPVQKEDDAENQKLLYHVYGVVFVGHIMRTTEGNLTFRIMNQPEYAVSAELYENQNMLEEAVKNCVGSLPGNLRAVE